MRYSRWVMGIGAVLVLYALAGFLLAPWLIQRQLPEMTRAALGREASVEQVHVNPFALSLRLQGFMLSETDGSPLLGFDELLVNLEASSLLRRAFTLSQLSLNGPYINLARDREGAVNLLKMLPTDPEQGPGPDAGRQSAGEQDSGLPRVVVHRLRIEKGVIDLTDQVPATPFHTRIGPFDVALDEISTLPERTGRHSLSFILESGTKLDIAGEVTLSPLHVVGQLDLEGPLLGLAQRYLQDDLAFAVASGRTEAALRFALSGAADGGIEAVLSDVNIRLSNARLTAPDMPDFLAWSEIRIVDGQVRWPAQELSAQALAIRGLSVTAGRDADGQVDMVRLLAPENAPAGAGQDDKQAADQAADPAAGLDAGADPQDPGEPGWQIRIAELGLEDAALHITDAMPATPASLSVVNLNASLRDVTSQPGAQLPLELSLGLGGGGTVTASGRVTLLPELDASAEVRVRDMQLAQFQPYVSDMVRIGISGGALSLDGSVVSNPEEAFAFDGALRIRGLDTVDAIKKERLLAWDGLGLDDLQLSLARSRATISRVRLEKPFARFYVAQDQTTNIEALLVEPGPEAAAPSGEATSPFRVRVGKVQVADGELDFTDLSLPLPFAADVQDMKGEFTTIDTRSSAPSNIRLEGRVGEFGLARVQGQVRVSDPTELADINVLFRNIDMPELSPYTVKFAGRKIAGGKINLDLGYKLDQRRMVGSNKIIIDELELGEKVPNPDAADLPLGLAVALLKDADGRIDIDMPVSGSLDDPEFRIGPVLWKAFVTLVTKVVTSPFRLLGNLVGMESEDMGRIEFAAGHADLKPPEREKLQRVGEALAKRPELGMEIPAAIDPEADAAELRTLKMQSQIEQELGADGEPGSGRGLERRTRRVVEALYEQRFPEQSLDALKEEFQAPPEDDPRGRPQLDELAYLDRLRADLAAGQEISEEELDALASRRAQAVSDELTTVGEVSPERVRISGRKNVKARDGAWVGADLGLAAVDDAPP